MDTIVTMMLCMALRSRTYMLHKKAFNQTYSEQNSLNFVWFVCIISDWWFSMDSDKLSLMNAKRFRCECGSSYSHNSSLRFHKRWECGKLPSFECPICKYLFKRKSNMTKHIQMVHGRKSQWITINHFNIQRVSFLYISKHH